MFSVEAALKMKWLGELLPVRIKRSRESLGVQSRRPTSA